MYADIIIKNAKCITVNNKKVFEWLAIKDEKIGKCDASHQELVKNWLTQNGLQQVEVSELFDIWWDYPTKNA